MPASRTPRLEPAVAGYLRLYGFPVFGDIDVVTGLAHCLVQVSIEALAPTLDTQRPLLLPQTQHRTLQRWCALLSDRLAGGTPRAREALAQRISTPPAELADIVAACALLVTEEKPRGNRLAGRRPAHVDLTGIREAELLHRAVLSLVAWSPSQFAQALAWRRFNDWSTYLAWLDQPLAARPTLTPRTAGASPEGRRVLRESLPSPPVD